MSAFLAYMAYLKTYLISLNFNFAKLEEKSEDFRPPTSRNHILNFFNFAFGSLQILCNSNYFLYSSTKIIKKQKAFATKKTIQSIPKIKIEKQVQK